MKERPILFSAPMVLALLAGTKPQTRREVKKKAALDCLACGFEPSFLAHPGNADLCPYGQPGDRLYVRETWQHSNHPFGPLDRDCHIFYRADYWDDPHGMDGEKSPEGKYREWKPSIHMPRWASRITLEITGVRVERLQDLSEADAEAEGIELVRVSESDYRYLDYLAKDCRDITYGSPVQSYASLWEFINGPGSWNANPWVWVIDFQVVDHG